MKKVSRLLIFSLAVSAAFPALIVAQTIPSGFRFNQNLTHGNTVDPDVKYLQLFLNSNAQTAVSATGAGSNAQLTNHFGQKTKDAVMRFQSLHASEVLTPAGLTQPTGNVGTYTRAKINSMLDIFFGSAANQTQQTSANQTTNTAVTQQQTSQPAATLSPTDLYSIITDGGDPIFTLRPDQMQMVSSGQTPITGFSVYKAVPGQTVTIYGNGFHPTQNVLYMGQFPIPNLPSSNGNATIEFTVPHALPDGYYHLAISNSYGMWTSGNLVLTVEREITAVASVAPTIAKVSPATSRYYNEPITVTGTDFSLFNNTIATNLGNISGLASPDRKTLRFIIASLPSYKRALQQYPGMAINLLVKVSNGAGLSNEVTHVIQMPSGDPLITTDANYIRWLLNGDVSTSTATTSQPVQQQGSSNGLNSSSGKVETEGDSSTTGGIEKLIELKKQLNPLAKMKIENSEKLMGLIMGGGSGGSGGGGLGGGGSTGGTTGGGEAGGGGGTATHFGGQISQVTYCTCSGSILLGIQDIATSQNMQVMYQYGQSTLHSNYNIFMSGINVIGGVNQSGGQCQVYSGTSCTTEGNAQYTIDTLRGVGTATLPAGGAGGAGGGAGGV